MSYELVWGNEVGEWVARQAGGAFVPGGAVALGLRESGRAILAGCFFENYNGRSLVAHLAIQRASRRFYWYLADYVFRQCGVHKLIAPVASTNTRMVRLALNMGFMEECRIKDAAPDGDILIMTMTREQCRFLEDRYGKT